jgi:protein involved in sex pheromone biosynthesis
LLPSAVWDNPELIGVAIETPKLMGKTECIAHASFVLDLSEAKSDERVKRKVEIAFAAIENAVLMKIRPVKPRGRDMTLDAAQP